MTAQYLWLIVFSFALYFIVTDESIAAAFYYVIRIATNYVRGRVWLITNDPRNPAVKYLIYRRSLKLAKELRAKIDKKLAENEKE